MSPAALSSPAVAAGDLLAKAREHWLARAHDELPHLPGGRLSFVSSLRELGRAVLEERGLPTARDDDWKYTSVASLAEVPFQRASTRLSRMTPASALIDEELRAGPAVVFVGGVLERAATHVTGLPEGVRVMSLAAALREVPHLVEPWLGRIARTDVHGLAALNAALFADGAVVLVEPGVKADVPLRLAFRGGADGAEAAIVRNLVVVGEGASVGVLEHYQSSPGPWLTSAVTEVVVGEGARLEHYKLEEESGTAFHVGSVEARVGRDAHFGSHLVAVGGALARCETRVQLAEPGAGCVVNGLYLPRGEAHLDCFTAIEHQKPHGTSQQLYKGVIDDEGRGVWTGRILVAEGAQKTSALQTNRNLLLSESAHVDTRPQLEIYADDVKCSHGAAVGRLDADALFYLRSRGIDLAAARSLLTYAFVSEVVTPMPWAPLRRSLERALAAGLLGTSEVAG
jgi:Fe-S cluster assembly protein SufD